MSRKHFSGNMGRTIAELDMDVSRLSGSGGADYPYLTRRDDMSKSNNQVGVRHLFSFSVVWGIAIFLSMGLLTTSAQTGAYFFTGSTTNIALNPGTYNITAYGGQGGSGFYGQAPGGLGTKVEGQFRFTTAVTLQLLVAGSGQAGGYGGGGGGGGSYVVQGISPLVVAGGGGGSGDSLLGGAGLIGGENIQYGPYGGGSGTGTYGSGGGGGTYGGGGGGGFGGGGAGYYGSGAGGTSGGGGDAMGIGGTGYGGSGGYGGGGAGGSGAGGGGGGYSGGGGGGAWGGGGGGSSYIDSTAIAIINQVSGVQSPDTFPNGEIVIAAVPPPLSISQSSNTISVYWPNEAGWELQQNTNLDVPAGWMQNTNWTTSNSTNFLNIVTPVGNMYFRLSPR